MPRNPNRVNDIGLHHKSLLLRFTTNWASDISGLTIYFLGTNTSPSTFERVSCHPSKMGSEQILLKKFVMSGSHAIRCLRNYICSSETHHSRYVERVVFAMEKALVVSAKSAWMKVWARSIFSQNCNSLASTPLRFLGNRTCPMMAHSKVSTRF